MENNCIRKIHLENFKNFKYIDADFECATDGDLSALGFLYGGNASGKTNLSSTFKFLHEMMNSLFISAIQMQKEFKNKPLYHYEDGDLFFKAQNKILDSETQKIIERYKRYGSDGKPLVVDVELRYNNIIYKYFIKCSDKSILHETLSYRDNVRMITIFDIDTDKFYLSKQHFLNKHFASILEMDHTMKKGKHTLLSIIKDYKRKNNKGFMKQALSKEVHDFIEVINSINIIDMNDVGVDNIDYYANHKSDILPNLLNGAVVDEERNLPLFNTSIRFMTQFYRKYMPTIDHLEYFKKREDGLIFYELQFVRINPEGKKIYINYKKESFGNRAFTTLITCFYYALHGDVIILDDVYMGLHDSILLRIMDDFANLANEYKKMNRNHPIGQLFVVAQNTVFMSYPKRNNIFVLYNANGQASEAVIKPVSSFSRIIQKTSNVRKMYLMENNNGKENPFLFKSGDSEVNLSEILDLL